jgi:hypothetical protein
MKQTIGLSQFQDAFESCRPNSFSYEGLELLFDFLEECDSEMELDVIALDCEYTEEAWQDIAEYFDIDLSDCDNDDDCIQAVIDHLNDSTCYIGRTDTDTLVYQQF